MICFWALLGSTSISAINTAEGIIIISKSLTNFLKDP